MIEVVCNLCGQDDWRIRFPGTLNNHKLNVDAFRCTTPDYGQHAQIVECQNCHLVYANPRWSSEDLIAAYSAVEDETYQSEREGRELTFTRHLNEFEKVIGPANGRSLLDIGAYIGVFVEIAAKAGWNALGIEPSEWAVKQAQTHGINVIQGTQNARELQRQKFDAITMWDVIEHFDDPNCEIARSYQLLKPGGWLVLHTMDIDSLTAKVMGRRWPWLMNMHLYYFSQASLAKMLVKNGFTVKWSGPQGRYLSLGYLTTRVGGLNKTLGRLATSLVNGLKLDKVAVPVNFGDLFTVYAQRPY